MALRRRRRSLGPSSPLQLWSSTSNDRVLSPQRSGRRSCARNPRPDRAGGGTIRHLGESRERPGTRATPRDTSQGPRRCAGVRGHRRASRSAARRPFARRAQRALRRGIPRVGIPAHRGSAADPAWHLHAGTGTEKAGCGQLSSADPLRTLLPAAELLACGCRRCRGDRSSLPPPFAAESAPDRSGGRDHPAAEPWERLAANPGQGSAEIAHFLPRARTHATRWHVRPGPHTSP